jgi:hypothetical protein
MRTTGRVNDESELRNIALQVILITLSVVLEQVFKQLITVPSNRNNLLYVDCRMAGGVDITAPREGGDVMGSEVKRRNKRRKYYATIIE